MKNLPSISERSVREVTEFPVQINDRLQITVKGTDEEIPTTYLSRVENISNGEIVIAWPTCRGIRAPVRVDELLCMTFMSCAAICSVDARITQRVVDPIALLTVLPEGSVRKMQRREYVRVPAMLEVRLSARVVMASVDPDSENDVNIITARTVNLSGGGFSIHYTAPPQIGNLYDVRFTLPGSEEPLSVTSKVVRCDSVGDPLRGVYYDVGFAFIQVKESIRRQIVSFVFRYQQASLV